MSLMVNSTFEYCFLLGLKSNYDYSSVKGNLNWLNELLVNNQNPSVNGQLLLEQKAILTE